MSHKQERPSSAAWSGGSARIIGLVSALLAYELAGHRRSLKRHVGASAGAVFAALAASKLSSIEIAHIVMERSFSTFFERKPMTWRPTKGLYSIEGLGRMVEEKVGGWPENVSIVVATHLGTMLCFTKHGVFERTKRGPWQELLKDERPIMPPPLSLCITYSCTLPGVSEQHVWEGRRLSDGGLGPDGVCPVGVLIDLHHAKPEEIVAFDLLGQPGLKVRSMQLLGHVLAGTLPMRPQRFWLQEHAGPVIRPDVSRFDRLHFNLPRLGQVYIPIRDFGLVQLGATVKDMKATVVDGFKATLSQLYAQGLMTAELLEVGLAVTSFEGIEMLLAERAA